MAFFSSAVSTLSTLVTAIGAGLGVWGVNFIIPYPVRSYLFIGDKKCRIYAACGVSQTPKKVKDKRSYKWNLQNQGYE